MDRRRIGPAAIYSALLAAGGLLSGLAFAVLAVMISADIVLRNLGVLNFPWLLEVSEYVVYGATFLAAPWVLRQGAHVRVDVLLNAVPRNAGRVMEVVADAVGLATVALFFYYSLQAALASQADDLLIFKELVILEWPLLMIMPLSSGLMAVEFVLRIRRALGEDPLDTGGMADGL